LWKELKEAYSLMEKLSSRKVEPKYLTYVTSLLNKGNQELRLAG
jgi:hypothetical protein